MTDTRAPKQNKSLRLAGIATYVAAAVLGYLLGVRGAFPLPEAGTSTPLRRLGFALREEKTRATPEEWAALRADVAAVRPAFNPEEREFFELIVALRGLASGGSADFAKAEALCRALKWPRCDQPALEELQKRSRP